MSISRETIELEAAFASGDEAAMDRALDAHPRTASALTRLYADAVGGGGFLTADTLRQERMGHFRRAHRDEQEWHTDEHEEPERWDGQS